MTAVAKFTPDGTLPPHHGLDVACCLEALLEEPVFEARIRSDHTPEGRSNEVSRRICEGTGSFLTPHGVI